VPLDLDVGELVLGGAILLLVQAREPWLHELEVGVDVDAEVLWIWPNFSI
jgi:hypothetical protein